MSPSVIPCHGCSHEATSEASAARISGRAADMAAARVDSDGARPGVGIEGSLGGQQCHGHEGEADRAGHIAPQLVRGQQLVTEQIQREAERARRPLSPAVERRQRCAEKQRDRHHGRPRRQLIAEEAPRPGHRGQAEGKDSHRLPQQVGQRERHPEPVQRAGDGEQWLEVDVAALGEAEQVRRQAAVGAGVTCPGQVLKLVGAQDAVGADQPVGPGEPGVEMPGVHEQQHEREQRPGCQARQQHRLHRRDTRPSLRHGGQD